MQAQAETPHSSSNLGRMHSGWAELQPGGAVVGSRDVGELYVALLRLQLRYHILHEHPGWLFRVEGASEVWLLSRVAKPTHIFASTQEKCERNRWM